jgi:hypothetical protein
MTKLQAIKDSIKHWKRMRAWVKKQKKSNVTDYYEMAKAIKETWTSGSCALCKFYEPNCKSCPLVKKHTGCGGEKTNWVKVDRSETWGEWYKNSTKMLKQLESLLPKRKKKC